jgi:sugar phosphate isomerase/epimerase
LQSKTHSRREFLKTASAAATGAVFSRAVSANSQPLDAGEKVAAAVKLGVASYSLRKFSRPEAIAMIKELRTPFVNVKSFHLTYESTKEELASGRQEFEAAGLQIVGGGTITLNKDEDNDIRSYFEYAKACGMPLMVIAPAPETLPRIEKFVKAYGIKVAIHNHGPEDKYFPSPYEALKMIRNMDARVGLCIDVGHTARTGVDVVKSIADAGPRLLDMHFKDLRDLKVKESQCIVGQGAMPVAGIFRQLMKMNYQGYVNLEYEIDETNPLPGMKESFAYMRGALAGMEG